MRIVGGLGEVLCQVGAGAQSLQFAGGASPAAHLSKHMGRGLDLGLAARLPPALASKRLDIDRGHVNDRPAQPTVLASQTGAAKRAERRGVDDDHMVGPVVVRRTPKASCC